MTAVLHPCSRIHELRRDPQLAAVEVLAAALDATEHALLAVHTQLPHTPNACCAIPANGDDDDLALAIVFAIRGLRNLVHTYVRVCTLLRPDDRPAHPIDAAGEPPDDDDIGF